MKWLGARASAALSVAGCVSALGIGACLSPTLPLPPPNDPTNLLVSDDRTSITMDGSGAIPGALVFILNEDVGHGEFTVAGVRGDYHLTVPLDLSRYDRNLFLIWQHSGSRDSETHEFYAPPRYGPGSLPSDDAGVGGAPDGAESDAATFADGAADAGTD